MKLIYFVIIGNGSAGNGLPLSCVVSDIFTIILLRRNPLRINIATKLFLTKYRDLSQSILSVLLFSLHLYTFSFLIKRVAIVKSL